MAHNFEQLRQLCQQNSDYTARVIDEELIYYAASRTGVESLMQKRFDKYHHAFAQMPQSAVNQYKAQYLAHLLFKEGGMVSRYNLSHLTKHWKEEERAFLQAQMDEPWWLTFSAIKNQPAPDFYEMEDVFRGGTFLLYSPAISRTLEDQQVLLWHSLVGSNGRCWQTFGPVAGYRSFDADDLFFFASELSHKPLLSDDDFIKNVESNPVPYMALLAYSNYPLVFSGPHEMRICISEVDLAQLPEREILNDFNIASHQGVHHLKPLGEAGEAPHLAEMFYDPEENLLVLQAQTAFAYDALVKTLGRYTIEVEEYPDIYLHQSMLMAAQDILQKDIELTPYSDSFAEDEPDSESRETLDTLNACMAEIVEDANAGRPSDIESLAARYQLETKTLRAIVQDLKNRLGAIKKDFPESS